MGVLITADVPGQTKEGYDGVLASVSEALRGAKGFVAHGAWPSNNGWQVFEIWETSEDAAEFFAKYIHPNLPPGVKPERNVQELYSLVRP
ncbi:MAG TPA: hypothetical protein VIH21_04190 [Dehalococcoidia bacterium]